MATVLTVSEAYSEYVGVWGGARVSDVVEDGFPTEGGGGGGVVSGDRYRGGSLEGLCGGGKFSAKKERDPT